MREALERASKLINDMMEEVGQALFVENAAAYLTDEEVDLSESDAICEAVTKRIDFLDAHFLAAIEVYVRATQARGDTLSASMLIAMRGEVMRQVTMRLPAAARVLDRILACPAKEGREAIMRLSMSGGDDDVPGVSADGLLTATSQFVDDMEEQPQVADRALLARMCLAREELRDLDLSAGFTGGPDDEFRQPSQAATFQRSNVPQRCAAFLKELVKVSEPARRVALLSRALENDWDGAAPRPSGMSSDLPDFVRPGRLMSTLQTMQNQLNLDGEANAPVLRRLEVIKTEALAVLNRMQAPPAGAVATAPPPPAASAPPSTPRVGRESA